LLNAFEKLPARRAVLIGCHRFMRATVISATCKDFLSTKRAGRFKSLVEAQIEGAVA
jgi:hypothetical protein